MQLFFDARYTKTGDFHDGISRYSAELGRGLLSLPETAKNDIEITFLICSDLQKKWFPKSARFLKIHEPTSAKEPLTALILNKYKPDLVFSPMQTIGSLGRKFKLIVTLHDLIYYRHRTPPKNLNAFIRLGWRAFHLSYLPQRLTLNAADAVATVSNTSKHDFKQVGITKRPIFVTPNASQNACVHFEDDLLGTASDPNAPSTTIHRPKRAKATPKLTAPTNLVYMGSFMKYKNIELLIAGLQYLPNHTLHLLSKISPQRKAEYEALKPKGAKVIYHNGVSDEAYIRLLKNKALLVTASLDEGYGIPVVDAAALGIPAVITDIPIFHEVAGKGALYFNPHSPEDFAKKVTEASKPATFKTLSCASLKHSQRFSWEKSARTLLKEALHLVQ